MKIVIFCHSLVSDWNHGNAHFLRGIVRELQRRAVDVRVYEPADGWSRQNLTADHGEQPLVEFAAAFPDLSSTTYELDLPTAPSRSRLRTGVVSELDLDATLDGADAVLVHEWNEPALVKAIGDHRKRNSGYTLLFHDTHHRSVTAPHEMARYDLDCYDGVLAFGASVARRYEQRGWGRRVWVWHEAADTTVFRPMPRRECEGDLVWVGNWGDDERTRELHEYLIGPVRDLRLDAAVYGVRYPVHAQESLAEAGIEYRGWLPNHRVPGVFAEYNFTVHVPRCPYAKALPGVPTIRVFEALACGIPLLSAPWDDAEGLFTPGEDYLLVHSGDQMKDAMRTPHSELQAVAKNGLATIRRRHTCAHRVDELLAILRECGAGKRLIGETCA
jgi:spore maturation protein CgeB